MTRRRDAFLVTVLILCASSTPSIAQTTTPPAAIDTALPRLYEDWKVSVVGQQATDADARAAAERERSRVRKLQDPFTPLAAMSCEQRRAKNERIVWEDDSVMVLVPLDPGSHLLVTPKQPANFLTDVSNETLTHLGQVAAATCDAMVVAGGNQPLPGSRACEMFVSPPARLGVAQLHVHVIVSRTAPVDDPFFRRTEAQIVQRLGGRGCL